MDAMSDRHTRSPLTRLGRFLPVLLVSVVGVVASLAAFGVARHRDDLATQGDLNLAAEDVSSVIRKATDSQLLILNSLCALHAASVEVERHEFTAFARSLLADHRGIQALEWIPRVPASERAAYEARATRDGLSDFQFTERRRQGQMIAAGQRDEYFPVYYMEPYTGNEAALGFDLASEPSRLAALAQARDDSTAKATGRVLLAQEKDRQYGFLIAMPVYKKATPTDSVASRRENLQGFMLGVFRVGDLLSAALTSRTAEDILVHVYDRSAPADGQLLYCRESHAHGHLRAPGREIPEAAHLTGMHHLALIDVAGRQWSVVCAPTSAFIAGGRTVWPWAMLGGGLLVTALSSAYLIVAARHSVRLENEIAERKRADGALRTSESRFRRLVESVIDYVYTVHIENGQFVRTDYGPGCMTVTGYTPEQYVADPELWINMVHADDRAAVLAHCDQLLAGTPRTHIEHRIIHQDGTTRWIENTLIERHDDQRQPIGYDGLIRDITRRKQAEAALQESEERLRQSQKMEAIGRLAGGVAHDFRNQLTIILGYAEMLERQGLVEGEGQEMLEQILAATRRSANTTSQLLAFSRQDVLQPATIGLHELVGRLGKTLKSLIEADVRLVIAYDCDECNVRVDPGQFNQAGINLVNNARDAMPDGGTLTLRAFGERSPDGIEWVALSVSDTGAGMDAETAAKAFEPFFTTKDIGQGTGLGLAMVHGFVTQSGGAVDVKSQPGEGTTFTLRFPRVAGDADISAGTVEATARP
jgi:PAS domain S-box-containing protein